MKKYVDSNYGQSYPSQVKQGVDNQKAKIFRCKECKIYFDSSGNYPAHFVYYGAPVGICKNRKEQ